MLEEWSNEQSPMFKINDQNIPNHNVKAYNKKPILTIKDWTDALKWDSQGHRFIQIFSTKEIYGISDSNKFLGK